MKYDAHTHVFHPKIAHKAIEQLSDHYGVTPVGTGLAEDLFERARSAGIDRVITLVAATAPAQVVPANTWTIEVGRAHPQTVPFGTLHPGYPGWEAELARLKAAGVKGLKFHPEFQGYRMDDPALLPMIEAAAPDFVMLFHVGDKLPPEQNPSCPYKMARLVRDFPDARFIAAHLGGYLHWKWALEALAGTRVWLDSSSSLPYIPDVLLRDLFRKHPRERILYGSDYPIHDPAADRPLLVKRLGFSEGEVDELMENVAALVG